MRVILGSTGSAHTFSSDGVEYPLRLLCFGHDRGADDWSLVVLVGRRHHARMLFLHWPALLLSALSAASALAATPPAHDVHWRCAVAYLPARSTWVRLVTIEHDARRVRAVRIDGVPVYAFHVQEALILTALDNERIVLDTAALAWQSDFRGQASGAGRCERMD